MGEVYLAQDTKLDRKVALKILPAEVAANQDRMRRFVQEAKAAAALNHPNIAHIYEIGESEGVNFIAIEFIDGQTLREVIHRGQTDLPKLLRYLQHTAEGLAEAHRVGIVHRDLKPDNIMITGAGYAKILDFGLAKLVEPQQASGHSTQPASEVATAILQQFSTPGVVLGTVGYMSPKQAQGKTNEIDHRSDIFSFGCILYEAVTRHKAFEGKDAIDSLNRIIREPVIPINEFRPDAPNHLQRIIRRCLAKDPEERYQTIKDIAIELRELRHEMNEQADVHASVPPSRSTVSISEARTDALSLSTKAPTPSSSNAEYLINEIKAHKRGVLVVLAVFILMLGGVGFGLYKLLGRKASVSFGPLKITRLTSTGQVDLAAITADGKYVFYVQDDGQKESIWMTQVTTGSNLQIVAPAEVHYSDLTVSHDGNFLYYVRFDRDYPSAALFRMPALGGNARKLLVDIFGSITLSPDDKRLAFVRCEHCFDTPIKAGEKPHRSTLIVANADGSDEKELVAHNFPNIFSPGGPAWSPDGKTIACGKVYRGPKEGGPHRSVMGVRVSDGKEEQITTQRWSGAGLTLMKIVWRPDSSGLLVSGGEQGSIARPIWYLSWPGDEARNLSNDLSDYTSLSMAADSTLVAIRSDRVINLWLAANGDANTAKRITSGFERADGERGISWTPDGKIVYCSTGGGSESIWINRPDGTENKQLSSGTLQNIWPVVSPDGRYIVWAARPVARWELWRMEIDGSNPTKLTDDGYFQDFSRDGKWVFYSPPNAKLLKIPIEGGTPTQVIEESVLRPAVSPDGQWLACFYHVLPEPGELGREKQWTVAIFPVNGGPAAKTFDLSTSGGNMKWTNDGKAIAYIASHGGLSNIWAQPIDGGPPKQLTDFKSEHIFNFAWSRDGKQLALSRGVVNRDVVLITGFN
jgi:serine/threonine protein kinase/Tol biopolymer transport system component